MTPSVSSLQTWQAPRTPVMSTAEPFSPGPGLVMDEDDSVIGSPSSPPTPVLPTRWLSFGSPPTRAKQAPVRAAQCTLRLRLTKEVIGKGAFSIVFRAFDNNGRQYAVKAFRKSVGPGVLDNEVRILGMLAGSPGIVGYHGVLGSEQLVLDHYELNLCDCVASYQNLTDEDLFNFERLNEPVVGRQRWLRWALQLTKTLQHLQARGVVHGDLKPRNILLNSGDDPLVLADFSSASASPTIEPSAFTALYSAPEVRDGEAASFSSDVYALGMVLLYCATGKEPYSEAKNAQQRLLWQQSVSPVESYDPESRQRLRGIETHIAGLLNRTSLDTVIAGLESALA